MPKSIKAADTLLGKYNILYSQFQQMTEERDEYKRALTELFKVFEDLKKRMRPVRQRGKARPQDSPEKLPALHP
jgi:uncharacterized coiled-coil DUF342 family protein